MTVRRLKSTVRRLDKNARTRTRVAQIVPARPGPTYPCGISTCHIPVAYSQCVSLRHIRLPYACSIPVPSHHMMPAWRASPLRACSRTRARGWGAKSAQRFIYIYLPPIFAQFLVLSTLYPRVKPAHYPRVPRPLLTPWPRPSIMRGWKTQSPPPPSPRRLSHLRPTCRASPA
jgi:hypothetical protein